MDPTEMETKMAYISKFGGQSLFIVIFMSLEDKQRVFKNKPYFYYNASLFMRHQEECYNLDQEKFMEAPVWVRLVTHLVDFWDPEILEGTGDFIRSFVKFANSKI